MKLENELQKKSDEVLTIDSNSIRKMDYTTIAFNKTYKLENNKKIPKMINQTRVTSTGIATVTTFKDQSLTIKL
jgi:hypothetical protein